MAYMNLTRFIALGTVIVTVLGACGGGAPGASTPTTPPPTAASLDVTVSALTVPSAATGTAGNIAVTVTAKDSQNRVVANVPINISATSGSVSVTDSKTKSDGTVAAVLTKGASRANRSIKITATAGSVTATQTVDVIGTVLNAQASKSVVPLGVGTETIIYTLQDSAGNPISGERVNIEFSSIGQSVTSTPTNASGVTTINIPSSSVAVTVVASATAAGARKDMTVIYSNSGTPAPTPAPLDFTVQATPAVVNVNATGSFANSSQIQVLVTGDGGALVNNALVSFERLDTNAAPSTFENTNDVPTSTGVAINRIRPGSQGTGQNQVLVCVSVKDVSGSAITPAVPYPTPNPCNNDPKKKPVFLTFAGSPTFVSISTGSTIADIESLRYRKSFSVLVTDNAGSPVSGATVSALVRPLFYGKGRYLGPVPGGRTTSFPPGIHPSIDANSTQGSLWCPNEDLNNDGLINSGEDHNSNGKIEPRQIAALSLSNGGITGSTGFLTLNLEYGKEFAAWVILELEVRALVGGSEGVASYTYFLLPSKPDVDALLAGGAPGFEFSPFGTATGVDVGFRTFGGKPIAKSCCNPVANCAP